MALSFSTINLIDPAVLLLHECYGTTDRSVDPNGGGIRGLPKDQSAQTDSLFAEDYDPHESPVDIDDVFRPMELSFNKQLQEELSAKASSMAKHPKRLQDAERLRQEERALQAVQLQKKLDGIAYLFAKDEIERGLPERFLNPFVKAFQAFEVEWSHHQTLIWILGQIANLAERKFNLDSVKDSELPGIRERILNKFKEQHCKKPGGTKSKRFDRRKRDLLTKLYPGNRTAGEKWFQSIKAFIPGAEADAVTAIETFRSTNPKLRLSPSAIYAGLQKLYVWEDDQ